MKKIISNKRAFTLIELLVVVLIIGILAAIAVPQYKKAVLKSKLTQVFVLADAYEKAIDFWRLENGEPSSYCYLTGNDDHNLCSEQLLIDAGQPDDYTAAGDIFGDLEIKALPGATNYTPWVIVITKLNGNQCGFSFRKPYHDSTGGKIMSDTWRFAGLANLSKGKVPAGCEDVTKVMCEHYKESGLVNGTGVTHCNSVGVTIQRAPYPWN